MSDAREELKRLIDASAPDAANLTSTEVAFIAHNISAAGYAKPSPAAEAGRDELVEDLNRRAAACQALLPGADRQRAERLEGKIAGYFHAAELAALSTRPAGESMGPLHPSMAAECPVCGDGLEVICRTCEAGESAGVAEAAFSQKSKPVSDLSTKQALQQLAAEVGGLRAFEGELRAELGNTNWNVLMLRLAEADQALAARASRPSLVDGGEG